MAESWFLTQLNTNSFYQTDKSSKTVKETSAQQKTDKKSIDWGGYILICCLGIPALFLAAYGVIFVIFVLLLSIVQDFLWKKR